MVEWFEMPDRIWPFIKGVPGWRREQGKLWIHRTHLPLLPDDYHLVPSGPTGKRYKTDGWELRDYQHEGVEFLRQRSGALLADQPRLGKTAQAVMAIKQWPALIVAPLATREVWISWLDRVYPGVPVYVCKGRTYDAQKAAKASAVFTHYDVAYEWQNAGGWDLGTLILDEIHLLSNLKTKRTQACMYASGRASHVIGLSGTPLWNQSASFYSVLKLLVAGAFGSFREFAERYCDAKPGMYGLTYGDPTNVEELQARLSEVMLRRTWKDVMPELPNTMRAIETAELTRKERTTIDLMLMAQGTPETFVGEAARLRSIVANRKISPAVRLAKTYLDSGEPVVLWVWHKKVATELARKLKTFNPVVITGGTPEDQRDGLLAQWRERGVSPLIMSLPIGQVGIDLSHARHAVFVELDYTPSVLSQAEMRTFSPARPMSIDYIVVDHPTEKMIVRTLAKKCNDALEMGVPCADTELDALTEAFGGEEKVDLVRMLAEL